MKVPEDLPYRRNVGIMLINQYNQVFVGQRLDFKSDAWQMPQGGIDNGETPEDAAFRELYEETGVSQAEIIAQTKEWLKYDIPESLQPKFWQGKFRGQQQKWFLMRLSGSDELIDINTATPEFHSWRWASIDELTEIIVPFKKEVYKKVIEEFRNYLD